MPALVDSLRDINPQGTGARTGAAENTAEEAVVQERRRDETSFRKTLYQGEAAPRTHAFCRSQFIGRTDCLTASAERAPRKIRDEGMLHAGIINHYREASQTVNG